MTGTRDEKKDDKKAAPKKSARKQELEDLRDDIRYLQVLYRDLKDKSPTKLLKVKALVASVPEGAQLLRLARRTGTKIAWGKNMADGLRGVTSPVNPKTKDDKHGWTRVDGLPKYKILLDPQAPVAEIAVTLAHELRHVWQNQRVEKNRILSMSPRVAVAYSRVLEGDARAFDAWFKARLEEKMQGRPRGEATPEDWKRAFDAFQKSADSGAYDGPQVGHIADIVGQVKKQVPEAPIAQKILSRLFNASARDGLKGLDKILVTGLSKKAAPYFKYKSEEALANEMVAHTRKRTRDRITRLESSIRHGK